MKTLSLGSCLALLVPLAAQSPVRLFDQAPGQTASQGPTVFGRTTRPGEMLALLDDGVRGPELWATNGTAAGTRFVFEFVGGPGGPLLLSAASDVARTVFVIDRGIGQEMWESDGSGAGTRLLFSAARLGVTFLDAPQLPLQIGGQWAFTADGDLWLSDGTVAGTTPVLVQTAQGLFRMQGGFVVSTFGGRFHAQHYQFGVSIFTPGSTVPFLSQVGPNATFELLRDEPILVQQFVGPPPFSLRTTTVTAIYRPGTPTQVFQGFGSPFPLANGLGFIDDSMLLWYWSLTQVPIVLHPAAMGNVLFVGNRWLFDGFDPATGNGPWVTDGTLAGT
ncbi:MAG: hypothetical protein FJ306_01765 [Planctomycetes bacterium]|nr:hypothetical protein [Planctomycetota bacterium]